MLQPHRQKTFKISTDPFFVVKVRDIVSLYLNLPDNAVVLCVDEKTQVLALDGTQPLLPMGVGYVAGVTHDYIRHGRITLFPALDIAPGKVIANADPAIGARNSWAFAGSWKQQFLLISTCTYCRQLCHAQAPRDV